MADIKLLKKITIKDVLEIKRGEDSKSVLSSLAENDTEICVISGEVTGYGVKATQYKASHFFVGMFFAQNRTNGKIFKATKIYLPEDFSENIVTTFNNKSEGTDSVRFQVSIKVVKDTSSNAGYTYICEPIKTPELINKEAEMMATFLQLPAPEKKKGK